MNPHVTSGTGGKPDAPNFPVDTSEVRALEKKWAIAFLAASIDAVSAASGNEINNLLNTISDQAFYEIHQIRQIPRKSERGDGWKPYIESWLRIREELCKGDTP